MMILRKKLYTIWDETDNLKRMKDSDILAEKKKDTGVTVNQFNNHMLKTTAGAATGGLIGAGLGAAAGLAGSGAGGRMASMGRRAGKLGKYGALIGGTTAAISSGLKLQKQRNDNRAYNERLEYAQRQAKRRERKDWKQNMTQRDGYSY